MHSPLNRVEGVGWGKEVTGNEPCSLMNQLVEGMLSVSARLSPHNGTCGVVHFVTTSCHIPLKKQQFVSNFSNIQCQNQHSLFQFSYLLQQINQQTDLLARLFENSYIVLLFMSPLIRLNFNYENLTQTNLDLFEIELPYFSCFMFSC